MLCLSGKYFKHQAVSPTPNGLFFQLQIKFTEQNLLWLHKVSYTMVRYQPNCEHLGYNKFFLVVNRSIYVSLYKLRFLFNFLGSTDHWRVMWHSSILRIIFKTISCHIEHDIIKTYLLLKLYFHLPFKSLMI